MLKKTYTCETKAADGGKRLKFIASTPSFDRDGDSLSVEGWQIDNYMKNPVVMLNHSHADLPVAKAIDLQKNLVKQQLIVTMEFPPDGTYPMADTVYKLAKAGFINAVSVGFAGLEFKPRSDGPGRIYTKQELYEISIVNVPANSQALQTAMAKGLLSNTEVKLLKTQKLPDINLDTIEAAPPKGGYKMTAQDEAILNSIYKPLSGQDAELLPRRNSKLTTKKAEPLTVTLDLGGGMTSVLSDHEAARFIGDLITREIEKEIKQARLLRRCGWRG